MIALTDREIWQELHGPFGHAEDLAKHLTALYASPNMEAVETIIWEHLCHQGSTYSSTLAALPHLLAVMDQVDAYEFKINMLLSLGVALKDFYVDKIDWAGYFQSEVLPRSVQRAIREAFVDGLRRLCAEFEVQRMHVRHWDEEDQVYFLVGYLAQHNEAVYADWLLAFSEGSEYVFACRQCEGEVFLWPKEGGLEAYNQDPVLAESVAKVSLTPNEEVLYLGRFADYVMQFGIQRLVGLLPYFAGAVHCPSCGEKARVWDGLLCSVGH